MTLKILARAASRYGVTPEAVGPARIFRDFAEMNSWIKFIAGWESAKASAYQQRVARDQWDRVIARVEAL